MVMVTRALAGVGGGCVEGETRSGAGGCRGRHSTGEVAAGLWLDSGLYSDVAHGPCDLDASEFGWIPRLSS